MPHLDAPTPKEWSRRRHWYESVEKDAFAEGGWALSEQACALADAVGAAYCAGAWLAAIRLGLDVIDAWPAKQWCVRATHPAMSQSARPMVENARRIAKDLVHLGLACPPRDVDEHWREAVLEQEARDVIQLLFRCLYPVPQPAATVGAFRSDGLRLHASPA